MTITAFAKKIEDYLQTAEQEPKNLAAFLKDKLQFMDLKAEGVAAIKLQRPDAQCVKSTQDWRKLGQRLKAGAFPNSIKLLTSYRQQYFVREGQQIPVVQASDRERQNILAGEISVQESIQTKMQLVYDIADTNCPPAEFGRFTQAPYQNASREQVYELMRELFRDKGVNCVDDNKMTLLDATGYYDEHKGEIHINDALKDYQKLSAFCECSAACI
ncbi:MAG: hypothetical protein ACERKO_13365, partial [Acetanaerobacterium sp.]